MFYKNKMKKLLLILPVLLVLNTCFSSNIDQIKKYVSWDEVIKTCSHPDDELCWDWSTNWRFEIVDRQYFQNKILDMSSYEIKYLDSIINILINYLESGKINNEILSKLNKYLETWKLDNKVFEKLQIFYKSFGNISLENLQKAKKYIDINYYEANETSLIWWRFIIEGYVESLGETQLGICIEDDCSWYPKIYPYIIKVVNTDIKSKESFESEYEYISPQEEYKKDMLRLWCLEDERFAYTIYLVEYKNKIKRSYFDMHSKELTKSLLETNANNLKKMEITMPYRIEPGRWTIACESYVTDIKIIE